jgi:hypothetical protein
MSLKGTPLEARFVNRTSTSKEIQMKRTIAYLSIMLALTVVAFSQTSQLKQAKAGCCPTCCPNGCGQHCSDGCAGSCCKGK